MLSNSSFRAQQCWANILGFNVLNYKLEHCCKVCNFRTLEHFNEQFKGETTRARNC